MPTPRLVENPSRELQGRVDLRGDNRLPDLLEQRESLMSEAKAIREQLKEIDIELDDKLGDAKEALINGWKVTQGWIDRPEHVVKATSFRRKYISRVGKRRRVVDTDA